MQTATKNSALVWFTQNLRVQDNQVLNEACTNHERVIAVYFMNPSLFTASQYGFKKMERFRAQFLLESLSELKRNLAALNISLIVVQDSASRGLAPIVESYSISTVYHQKEWTYEEQIELESVQKSLSSEILFKSFYDQFLIDPTALKLEIAAIPSVFTKFRKWVEKQCEPNVPITPMGKKPANLLSEKTEIPTLEDLGFDAFMMHAKTAFPFKGGEDQALERIDHYFFKSKKLGFYKKTRNGLVGIDYSSKLSAWLANGSLSARTIYQHVKEFEQRYYSNQSTYWLIFELLWRDYFKYVSLKFGNAIFHRGGILALDRPSTLDPTTLEKWIAGRTMDPFVNANMIELKETGWMSNRGRQNVASYFSRTLAQDWRVGAAYFEAMLIDYDVHSNYGNWMYVAGVGNDPRSRVFNCKLQAERYDSDGRFRRQWLQPKLF